MLCPRNRFSLPRTQRVVAGEDGDAHLAHGSSAPDGGGTEDTSGTKDTPAAAGTAMPTAMSSLFAFESPPSKKPVDGKVSIVQNVEMSLQI